MSVERLTNKTITGIRDMRMKSVVETLPDGSQHVWPSAAAALAKEAE